MKQNHEMRLKEIQQNLKKLLDEVKGIAQEYGPDKYEKANEYWFKPIDCTVNALFYSFEQKHWWDYGTANSA